MSITTRTLKLTLPRKPLLDILVEAKRFADAKSTMPILSTVLLRCDGDVVTVAATDLNMWLVAPLKAAGRDGDAVGCCIDARRLHDVVKALPGAEVGLEVVESTSTTQETSVEHLFCVDCGWKVAKTTLAKRCGKGTCVGDLVDTKTTTKTTTTATLTSNKSKFKLSALNAVDFPKLPDTTSLQWQTVPSSLLANLIDTVGFSMSKDETRAHLCGMLLETCGGKVVAVSTDGHRLSKAQRNSGGFSLPGIVDKTGVTKERPVSILIPRAAVAEVRKHCGKGVAAVDVAVAKQHLFVREHGDTAIYSMRLADAQFPPYSQVIPRHCERFAVVDVAALREAMKRLMLVASEKTHGVKLSWMSTMLTITTDNADGDAGEEVLDVVKADMPTAFTVGVNGQYLLDVLDKVSTSATWIGMNGEPDPLMLRPESGGVDDVFVVMPMRL